MEIVFKPGKDQTARQIGADRVAARKQRVPLRGGGSREVWTVDMNSNSFDLDLTYVFGRNVEKARRENKKLTGSADGVRRA